MNFKCYFSLWKALVKVPLFSSFKDQPQPPNVYVSFYPGYFALRVQCLTEKKNLEKTIEILGVLTHDTL